MKPLKLSCCLRLRLVRIFALWDVFLPARSLMLFARVLGDVFLPRCRMWNPALNLEGGLEGGYVGRSIWQPSFIRPAGIRRFWKIF